MAVVPTTPKLRLSDLEVSDATKRTLGLPPAGARELPAVCGQCKSPIGPNEHWHALTCVENTPKGKTTRHNALAGEVKTAFEEAGGSAEKETPHLDRNSAKRPADVQGIIDEENWVDVQVKSALAPSSMQRGDPVEQAERDKQEKYRTMVRDFEAPVRFVPFIVDTYGRLGEHAKELITRLAAHAKATGKAEEKTFKRSITDRLAICLQKHNTRITRKWQIDTQLKAAAEKAMMATQDAVAKATPMETE